MNEGDNFGTVNGGSGQPDNNIPYNSDPFGQPTTPIMSSPDAAAGQENVSAAPNNNVGVDQGNIPVVSTEGMSNTSKFFGGRARRAFNRNVDTQQQNFLAAQNIASNPNTPQFFSDAVISDNPMPIASPRSKSKKPIIIGAIALVFISVIGIVIAMVAGVVPSPTNNDISKKIDEYLSLVIGDDYKDYRGNSLDPTRGFAIGENIETNKRNEAKKYYEKLSALLGDIYDGLSDKDDIKEVFKRDKISLFYYYESSRIIYPEAGKDINLSALKNEHDRITSNKQSFDNAEADEREKKLYSDLLEYINNKKKVVSFYQSKGCVINNEYDYECVYRIDELPESDIKNFNDSAARINITNQAGRIKILNDALTIKNSLEENKR